jgi:hypothetical protein
MAPRDGVGLRRKVEPDPKSSPDRTRTRGLLKGFATPSISR